MPIRRDVIMLAAGVAGLGGATVLYTEALHVGHPLIVGFTFLLIVLLVAANARFWAPAVVSVVAMLAFNFFFLAPVGTLYLSDPQNWVALFVFLTVSLVASTLSTTARARARDAIGRQQELARLFELTRDVLLSTDGGEAVSQLAAAIARRFALEFVAICLPVGTGWSVHRGGTVALALEPAELSPGLPDAGAAPEARVAAPEHRTIEVQGRILRLAPLRLGTKAVGLLAVGGRSIESATLDALAGVAAIAVDRGQVLEERKAGELARRSEAFKSALLASIAHDLRTPLTAIRVAASNLQATWLTGPERREQSDLILAEVERLHRLFQNILDMARIEAGGVSADRRWTHPSEIIEAAREQTEVALHGHPLHVDVASDAAVFVDPRLTAAALAHVLENAGQYSPAGAPIAVRVDVDAEGLALTVRDHGPGIGPGDLPHLFERFYRGAGSARRTAGTGMGLAIARGMLAAEDGRISAENCAGTGARFTIVVPAEHRAAAACEPIT